MGNKIMVSNNSLILKLFFDNLNASHVPIIDEKTVAINATFNDNNMGLSVIATSYLKN